MCKYDSQVKSKSITGSGGSAGWLNLVCLTNLDIPVGLATLRDAVLTGLVGARNLVCPPKPSYPRLNTEAPACSADFRDICCDGFKTAFCKGEAILVVFTTDSPILQQKATHNSKINQGPLH